MVKKKKLSYVGRSTNIVPKTTDLVERCKAYTIQGQQCRNKATINGYCLIHYKPE